jgi:mRNA interferase MazF
MKSYKHGDVVMINLGGEENSEGGQPHYAVIISGDVINEHLQTVIVCPLIESKQVSKSRIGATLIPKEAIGMEENCLAFSLQIKTITKERILRKVSSLPTDYLLQLRESIQAVLNFD